MTEKPDIVARLRAYTQHNRPVLASDLKEAADELDSMRRHIRTLLDTRESNEREIENLRRGPSDSLLIELVVAVSDAAGRKVAPNAFDRHGLMNLVDDVRALRRERDDLMPQEVEDDETVIAAESHRPGAMPPTTDQRFDDIDRRLALLESSVRMTDRRLDAAHEAMYDTSKVASPSPVLIARALSRTLARDNDDV